LSSAVNADAPIASAIAQEYSTALFVIAMISPFTFSSSPTYS
jgi:hypothetical protein